MKNAAENEAEKVIVKLSAKSFKKLLVDQLKP